MRPFLALLACSLLLSLPLRAQEDDAADESKVEADDSASAEAPADLPGARPSRSRQRYIGAASRAAAPSSAPEAESSGGGDAPSAAPARGAAPSEDSSGSRTQSASPSSAVRSIGSPGGGMRALSSAMGAGGRAFTGASPSGGAGGGATLSEYGPMDSGGTDSPRQGRGRPSYKTLGQLSGVNKITKGSLGADGEAGSAMNSRAWDGGKAKSVGVKGPEGGGGGGGAKQPTELKPGDPADTESGPIFGEDGQPVDPPAKNVTPWQSLLDKAQLLLKRASQLLSISSLTVFIGKQLARTGFGGAFGAGMIAAGAAMAGVAAGLAAAATALGAIILLKYKQKLQGAVLTVSGLALTISAARAAQGNRDAYDKYKNAEQRAITEAARKAQYGMGLSSIFLNREGIGALRTGANFVIGDTKAGTYMNAAFGVYDGVSGLTGGGGPKAAIQGALGLAQTWQAVAPTKGQNGEILRTALTGAQIASDMWPESKPKPAPAKPEDKTVKLDANGKPIPGFAADGAAPPLESRPIGDGTATLAPGAVPANSAALAAAREQAKVESQIRSDTADFAAKNNITDPKAIESIVQSSLKSRADYDAAHPGAPEPTASVTTTEGPVRIKTDSPEYMSAVPPSAEKLNPVFNNPAVTSKYSELRSVTTSDGSTQVIGRDPNGGWSSWDANGKFTGQITNAQASGLTASNPSTRTDLSAQNAAAAQKREADLGMQQAIADAQAAGVMDAQGRPIIRSAAAAPPVKTQSDLAPGTLQYTTAVALKGQAYVDSLGKYVPPKDNIAEWQKSALDGVGSCTGVMGCTGAHLNSMAAEGTNLGRTVVTGMVAPMVGVATGISIDAAIKNPTSENLTTLAMGTPGVNLVAGEVLGLAGLARGGARLVPDLINNDPRSQQDMVEVSGGLLALIPFAGGRNITAPKPTETGVAALERAPVAGVPETAVRTDVPEIVVAKPVVPEAVVGKPLEPGAPGTPGVSAVNTLRGKTGEPVVVRGDVKIVSPEVVSIESSQGPRDIIVVQTENGPQPMYRSTGQNSGKTGEWLPFDGAREHAVANDPNGWFDKNAYAGSGKSDPLARYGTPELQKISQDLGKMNIPEGRTVTSAGANDAIVNAGGELGEVVRFSQDLAVAEGTRPTPPARGPPKPPPAPPAASVPEFEIVDGPELEIAPARPAAKAPPAERPAGPPALTAGDKQVLSDLEAGGAPPRQIAAQRQALGTKNQVLQSETLSPGDYVHGTSMDNLREIISSGGMDPGVNNIDGVAVYAQKILPSDLAEGRITALTSYGAKAGEASASAPVLLRIKDLPFDGPAYASQAKAIPTLKNIEVFDPASGRWTPAEELKARWEGAPVAPAEPAAPVASIPEPAPRAARIPEAEFEPAPAPAPKAPNLAVTEKDANPLSYVGLTNQPNTDTPAGPQSAAPALVAGAAAGPVTRENSDKPAPVAAAADPKAAEPAYGAARELLVAKGRDPVLVDQAIAESVKQGVDPLLVLSVIEQESRFKPDATSYKTEVLVKKGSVIPGTDQIATKNISGYSHDADGNKIPLARGVMQITDPTGAYLGVENPSTSLYDPQTNLTAGIGYLKTLTGRFGTSSGVAAYNAGPGAVAKYKGEVPPYQETQDYVTNVLANQTLLQAAGVAPMPPLVAKAPIAAKSKSAPPAPRKRGG